MSVLLLALIAVVLQPARCAPIAKRASLLASSLDNNVHLLQNEPVSEECARSENWQGSEDLIEAQTHYWTHVEQCFNRSTPEEDANFTSVLDCADGTPEYEQVCATVNGTFCGISITFEYDDPNGTLHTHYEDITIYQCLPEECNNELDMSSIERYLELYLEGRIEGENDNNVDVTWLCKAAEFIPGRSCGSHEFCPSEEYCNTDSLCISACACNQILDPIDGQCPCERCAFYDPSEECFSSSAGSDDGAISPTKVTLIVVGSVGAVAAASCLIIFFMQRRNRILAGELRQERLPPRSFHPMIEDETEVSDA